MDKDLKKEGLISPELSNSLHESLVQRLVSFDALLEGIRSQLSQPVLSEQAQSQPDTTATFLGVRQQLLQCQPLFQEIVAQLANADLTSVVEQRIRPAQTEAHRLLRLMGVDAMRLAAAKKPETKDKLRSQLLTQTERLQGFLQVIADAM